MTEALINARIFTGERLLEDHAVLLEAGRIREIPRRDRVNLRHHQSTDIGGGLLLPGFIDLQVNGGGGVLFNEAPSVESIAEIGAAHRRFGTCGFMPTLISDDMPVMAAAIHAVREAMAAGVPGLLGIHLEGPFLNPARRGAHAQEKLRRLDARAVTLLGAGCGGKTMVTLAPELAPEEHIRALVQAGVVVCAGHSDARYDEVQTALQAGLNGFTHLFNAMSPLLSREPGVVGAALSHEDSWCGVIVDSYHVHPATLRVALAAKPRGKIYLVTDAMPPAGGGTSSYRLNGQTVQLEQGRCATPDGTLAGSSLTMADAVRNCVTLLDLDWREAVRMASCYPAQHLGLDQELGFLRPGYRGNLVWMDDNFEVVNTWIDGQAAWRHG